MGCFWKKTKYIMLELKNTIEELCLKENGLVLSKMIWRIWQIFVYRLKNSDFISESKVAELNQNKNSKQQDQPDTVWKLYFTLEMNE